MPNQPAKKNSKRPHSSQPKRQRYNVEARGYKRRLKDLDRHIEHNPNDAVAKDARPRVLGIYAGARGNR
jgi:hypothetical protein